MWAAVKTAHSNPGAKKAGLAKWKTK
jgi:hypothetical protein